MDTSRRTLRAGGRGGLEPRTWNRSIKDPISIELR